jgi:hypothetical protein
MLPQIGKQKSRQKNQTEHLHDNETSLKRNKLKEKYKMPLSHKLPDISTYANSTNKLTRDTPNDNMSLKLSENSVFASSNEKLSRSKLFEHSFIQNSKDKYNDTFESKLKISLAEKNEEDQDDGIPKHTNQIRSETINQLVYNKNSIKYLPSESRHKLFATKAIENERELINQLLQKTKASKLTLLSRQTGNEILPSKSTVVENLTETQSKNISYTNIKLSPDKEVDKKYLFKFKSKIFAKPSNPKTYLDLSENYNSLSSNLQVLVKLKDKTKAPNEAKHNNSTETVSESLLNIKATELKSKHLLHLPNIHGKHESVLTERSQNQSLNLNKKTNEIKYTPKIINGDYSTLNPSQRKSIQVEKSSLKNTPDYRSLCSSELSNEADRIARFYPSINKNRGLSKSNNTLTTTYINLNPPPSTSTDNTDQTLVNSVYLKKYHDRIADYDIRHRDLLAFTINH